MLMIALVLMLGGCRTAPSSIEYQAPTLDAFRPSWAPVDLIAEPQTDRDLLHNSVIWEYWGYAWQDFALALEDMKSPGIR